MKPLKDTQLDHASYKRLDMRADVPAGVTLADILTPAYWSNCARRLKSGALIEILSEDFTLDCQVRVLEVGPTFAKVRLIRNFVEAAAPAAAPTAVELGEIDVTFGGKQDGWRVLHMGKVIKNGFATRAEAEAAAQEYRNKLAA